MIYNAVNEKEYNAVRGGWSEVRGGGCGDVAAHTL